MKLQRLIELKKEIAIRLISFPDNSLVNVCCSGNKIWSELAIKEYEKRKRLRQGNVSTCTINNEKTKTRGQTQRSRPTKTTA